MKYFRITHPFHPLHGREFEVIDLRSAWGEERVYFRDDAGELQRMPLPWTSLWPVDPFVAVCAGRSNLRTQELLQMVEIVQRLDEAQGPKRRTRKAKGVK